MAQQIKKKYIENNAIDGDKIKLLQQQSIRATNSQGQEIDLISIDSDDKILINGQEAATQSNLLAEKVAREIGDNNLQSQIDNIISNTDPAALDSLTEVVAAFQSSDQNIATAISNLSAGSSSSLGQETAERQLADAVLQDNINAEIAERESEDSALDARLSSIESITWASYKVTVDSVIVTSKFIDLPNSIVNGSLIACIDRLSIHENEDYVISSAGGITRITFIGDFVNGGEQNISVGDNLYFKYQYLQQ